MLKLNTKELTALRDTGSNLVARIRALELKYNVVEDELVLNKEVIDKWVKLITNGLLDESAKDADKPLFYLMHTEEEAIIYKLEEFKGAIYDVEQAGPEGTVSLYAVLYRKNKWEQILLMSNTDGEWMRHQPDFIKYGHL
jgi:hypothetical protein